MTKVLIASQPNGSLQNTRGDAQSTAVEFRNPDGTAPNHFDGTLVTHYADAAGTSPLTTPITPDSRGRIMRWITTGYYKQIVGPGTASAESLDFHTVSGQDIAIIKEAPLNVQYPEYGAVGDNSTDDTAAFKLIETAVVGAGGGAVHVPYGRYPVSCVSDQLWDFGADTHVTITGDGSANIGGDFGTIIRRTAGTNELLKVQGSSDSLRGHVTVRGLELNGGATAGDIVYLYRVNETLFDDVRLNNATGRLLRAEQAWNCRFINGFFYAGGNGTATPAVLFTHPAGVASNAGSQTVHLVGCEWENNTGTDLEINGSVADTVYSNTFMITAPKFERQVASATYPVIRLGYFGRVAIAGGSIGAGGTSTTSKLIEITSDAHTIDGHLSLAGVQMTQNASPTVYIDMQAGFLSMAGCFLRDAPATAYINVASGVGQEAVQLAGNVYGSPGLVMADARAGASYSFAYGQLWETGLVGGAVHGTIGNFACVDLVDAASSGVALAGRMDTRFIANTTTVLRVAYTSTVGGNNVRWQLRKLLPGTGTDLTGAGTATPVTDAAPGTANQMKFVDLTVTGSTNPGSLQMFELRRLGADAADTNTGTVKIVSVDMINNRRL